MIDITIHCGNPAINIKCYTGFFDTALPSEMDLAFNNKWVQDNMTDEDMSFWWGQTAAWEVEHLINEGKRIFDDIDYEVNIYQSGRSGGWLEVMNLPEPKDWDKELMDAWTRFEDLCEVAVEDFPRTLLETVYANVWETRNDEQDKIEAIWEEIRTYMQSICHADYSLDPLKNECPLLVAKIEGKD